MDPLEGSSTSLLPSVPGLRRSSRQHMRTGELSPSRSRSPHTPPASRARGGRARGGSARGGASPSRSRSPHTPPARGGRARGGRARGGRARGGRARGGRARGGPARGGRARGGRARGGRSRGGGGPGSSEPPSSSDDASSGSSSSSEEDTAIAKRFPRPRNRRDATLCRKWRKQEPNGNVFPFAGPQPGPTVAVTRATTAANLFDRFFTGEVWELIIEESNRHARELNL